MMRTQGSKVCRAIGSVMILCLVLSMGVVPVVEATSLTDASDTMGSSAPSATTTHTFDFTTGQNPGNNGYFEITFDGGFDLTGVTPATDVTCPGGGTASKPTAQVIRCQYTTGLAATTTWIEVVDVVSPAKVAAAGVADTYTHWLRNRNASDTILEESQVMVAIIDQVTVTASVDATLEFSVSPVATGTTVNGSSTTFTTTSTTIPFGTVQPGVANVEIGAQQLTVTTNADYGFIVTVEQSQNLTSAASSDIDSFQDGTAQTTPIAWTTPAGTLGSENTYGHMGITSDDANLLADGGPDFSSAKYGGFNSTDPFTVFASTGPADGSTQNVGVAKVAYRIEINALQEAGDYTNTLTYICTPSY